MTGFWEAVSFAHYVYNARFHTQSMLARIRQRVLNPAELASGRVYSGFGVEEESGIPRLSDRFRHRIRLDVWDQ